MSHGRPLLYRNVNGFVQFLRSEVFHLCRGTNRRAARAAVSRCRMLLFGAAVSNPLVVQVVGITQQGSGTLQLRLNPASPGVQAMQTCIRAAQSPPLIDQDMDEAPSLWNPCTARLATYIRKPT